MVLFWKIVCLKDFVPTVKHHLRCWLLATFCKSVKPVVVVVVVAIVVVVVVVVAAAVAVAVAVVVVVVAVVVDLSKLVKVRYRGFGMVGVPSLSY